MTIVRNGAPESLWEEQLNNWEEQQNQNSHGLNAKQPKIWEMDKDNNARGLAGEFIQATGKGTKDMASAKMPQDLGVACFMSSWKRFPCGFPYIIGLEQAQGPVDDLLSRYQGHGCAPWISLCHTVSAVL